MYRLLAASAVVETANSAALSDYGVNVLRRPLANKFKHVAIVPANAYQRTKFQLSSWISFGDIMGVPKWELLISPDASLQTNFYTGR